MSEPKDSNRQVLQLLEKQITDLSTDLKEIKQLLAGSSFGEGGLVNIVTKNQDRLKELEEFKKKITGYAVGVSAGTGGAVSIIINLFS